ESQHLPLPPSCTCEIQVGNLGGTNDRQPTAKTFRLLCSLAASTIRCALRAQAHGQRGVSLRSVQSVSVPPTAHIAHVGVPLDGYVEALVLEYLSSQDIGADLRERGSG